MYPCRSNFLGSFPWFLTVVYSSPHYARSQSLWDDLLEVHSSISVLWAIMGGFNSILHDFECVGLPLQNSQSVETGFQDLLSHYNLLDLGYQGDPFTLERGNTGKRLDRAISNIEWCLRLKTLILFTHLSCLSSNLIMLPFS